MGASPITVGLVTPVPAAPQMDRYELVILNSAGTQVLLQEVDGNHSLPAVQIPRFTRPAEKITSLLRNSWNTKAVLMWSGRMQPESDADCFAVLESIDDSEQMSPGLRWFALSEASALVDRPQSTLIQNSQSKALRMCSGVDPDPFSRLGWFDRIKQWVNRLVSPSGTEVRDFVQLNGCETFSLVKFETSSEPVWFKAVGEPNLREFSITLLLARLFPYCLPKVLASDPLLHGWVMADDGGVSLNEVKDPSAWRKTLTTLAHMQIDSIGTTDELLGAGCRDLRLPTLLKLVDLFLDTMADLMTQQPKTPPPKLTRQELHVLGKTLKDALHCLGDLQIPDTLGHKDFNPGNIIVGPERCIFIDWAEAFVGHPLFTFEYFVSHLRKNHSEAGRLEDVLKSSYSEGWMAILSPENLTEAFLFSPLAAVFAYAAASTAWRDQERLKSPRAPAYLRSLTRRMKREADLLQERRVECLR